MERLQAVLFDSGGVLVRPVGGRWNPRFDFEPTVLRFAPHLTGEDFSRAMAAGERFFAVAPADHTRDDYHNAMLREIGVEPTSELLHELDRPLEPATVVELYPEVLHVLRELRKRGVRMAVVSDNQPGLERLHAGLGLGTFFEAYALSAVLGCTKPDPRMYRHVSDALGLEPSACLFVDDVPDLVSAAVALGYRGVAITREPRSATSDVEEIPDLTGVLSLV